MKKTSQANTCRAWSWINRIGRMLLSSAAIGSTGMLPAHAQTALPSLNVNIDETSISGISSGAYMAVQFAVAHSALVRGVGAIAGGPYYCAKDDLEIAYRGCMVG